MRLDSPRRALVFAFHDVDGIVAVGTTADVRRLAGALGAEILGVDLRDLSPAVAAELRGRELTVDLGEICHYMTDFFTYPHNDDIYTHNLFAHYVYEKRVAFVIRRRMTEAKFEQWVSPIIPPTSVDALLNRITDMHDAYRAAGRHHGIDDDLVHICRATATVVLSIISIVYEQVEETAPALA